MREPPSRPTASILIVMVLVVPALAVLGVWFLRTPGAPVVSAVPSVRTSAPPEPPPTAQDRRAGIRGRVLDADGNPAAGAAVRLITAASPSKILVDTTSNAAGEFAFSSVGPLAVRVVADRDPDGFVTSAELRVAAGKTVELTLVLSAAGAIVGRVVDADDHPVAGAALSVEGVAWIARKATSDAAGAFRVPAVPREVTVLVAVARGYRTARVPLVWRENQADVVVRVRLEGAPPIAGEVHDPDDKPLHARVVACEGQPPETRVESGDDGTFQLPPSTMDCQAVAQHDDYAPSDAVSVGEGRPLVLRLKPGGAIEGVVVDDRGAGIPSFTVGIESFAGAQRRGSGNGGARTIEDPRGAFRWDKLAPGTYVLTASAPDKPPTRSDPVDVAGGAAAHVRIVLLQGGAVAGRVFDEHRTPLGDVELHFDTVSSVVPSGASTKTDAAGRYRLEGAPGGPFTLRAQKDGFRARMISGLHVDSRATLTQDVILTAMDGGPGLELGGIGANVAPTPEGISLAVVFPGEPADRAGLRAGDRVLRIDGEETDRMSAADVIQRLRGEPGTVVGVSAGRAKETLDVIVTRAAIVR